METRKIPCSEAAKRFWRRRRRYQKLGNGNSSGRRRLKVVRLGGSGAGRTMTMLGDTRLRMKLSALSPLRLLARFHDAYVEMMMGIAVGVARRKTILGKRVCRESQASVVSTGEEVDQRLVLEVYRRIAASRQLVEE